MVGSSHRGSADHLVCQDEECRGHRQAKCLRGLQVDHQLELGGLLDGQVGWLRTREDLVHVHAVEPEWHSVKRNIFYINPTTRVLAHF
jgi:hypothetical protein